MKTILLLLIVFIGLVSFGQSDTITVYNYNNTLTGMYTDNNSKQINMSYSGDNGVVKGYKAFNSNTTYSYTYTTKTTNNELLQKTNVGYDNFFLSHILNHSLTRTIVIDNSIGVGYGHWWKYMSISYASMFERTIYETKPNISIFRHSLRYKLKYDHNLFSISAEYYYQPNMIKLADVIVYGTTKITFLQKSKLNFTITDIVNYRPISTTPLMHSISLGVTYNLKITHKNIAH